MPKLLRIYTFDSSYRVPKFAMLAQLEFSIQGGDKTSSSPGYGTVILRLGTLAGHSHKDRLKSHTVGNTLFFVKRILVLSYS